MRTGGTPTDRARRTNARSLKLRTSDRINLAIPAQLRTYATLDADVIVNGAINHVEIWDARRWGDIDAEGSQFLLSGTDALDDIGF